MIREADFKGWFHAGFGAVSAVACAYNLMRCCATSHRRNAMNTGLYLALAVYELDQARAHWSYDHRLSNP